MKEEPKMNYCCDCGWAVKKGLFRKTWYCTCPEILEKNLDTVLCIVDTKRTECRKLREDMFGDHFEFLPCPNYKGELRHHPAIPPMKCPLPCPPLPERVEKATQEHDAAYLMKKECIREIYTIANEEAGHCDSACPNDEMEKLEGEKHKLKVAVQFLVNEMKSFCFCYCHTGKCEKFDHGCYQTCEIYKDIKQYDCLEDGK